MTALSHLPPAKREMSLEMALCHSLLSRTHYRGEVLLPCIPSAIDHYLRHLADLFASFGKPLVEAEQQQLRQTLESALKHGFQITANAQLVLRYDITVTPALQKNLACQVALSQPAIADQYKTWSETKSAAMFGAHADAKVLAVAAELPDPTQAVILDVGAGTGRNSLPLAQQGFTIDALELTPEFAQRLRQAAQTQGLPITVIAGDVLRPETIVPANRYHLAIVSEVITHFRTPTQLRQLFVRLSEALCSGGILLFNLFLAVDGFEPDALTQEVAEAAWSTVFTGSHLTEALAGLPLNLVSDESVFDYEQAHLPQTAFPPTDWFAAWSTGHSVFPSLPEPPMVLRWIRCNRR